MHAYIHILQDPAKAAEAFAKVQEKLAALEKKRESVHEQARMSSEALAQAKAAAAEIEKHHLKVMSDLARENERKRQLREAVLQTNEALAHAHASAQRVAHVHQQTAETKDQLTARLRAQIAELKTRHEEQREMLKQAKEERGEAEEAEKKLQTQLLNLQSAAVGDEQEVQQRLLAIHEAQAVISSMELEEIETQRDAAARSDAAQQAVKELQAKLKECEKNEVQKHQLLGEKEAETSRLLAEGSVIGHNIDVLQQRVASLENSTANATGMGAEGGGGGDTHEKEEEEDAIEEAFEMLKEAPPPSPFFSWTQKAEAVTAKLKSLRSKARDQELAARRATSRIQQARCRAAQSSASTARLRASNGNSSTAAEQEQMQDMAHMQRLLAGLEEKRDRMSMSLALVREHKQEMQMRIMQLENQVVNSDVDQDSEVQKARSRNEALEVTRRNLLNASTSAQAENRNLKLRIIGHTEAIARLELDVNATLEQTSGLSSLIAQVC
jgi:chromosome segregation ATPase